MQIQKRREDRGQETEKGRESPFKLPDCTNLRTDFIFEAAVGKPSKWWTKTKGLDPFIAMRLHFCPTPEFDKRGSRST